MTSVIISRSSADDELSQRRPSIIVWLCFGTVACFLAWSYLAMLAEVAVGSGKVIPSSRGKVIQTLEGGILAEMFVTEGDIVESGQRLATLDDTRFKATLGEADARIRALTASAARLTAQMNDAELIFPERIRNEIDLVNRERALFDSQREAYVSTLSNLEKMKELTDRELNLTAPLVKKGAASPVEVLRLEQQTTEYSRKINELKNQYIISARENYTKVMAELEPLEKANEGRRDQLERTVLTAPVRGIVNNVEINTIGGVISPGGSILEIVPLEDQLLVETKVNPRDIAFVRPGLEAAVKLTAYDSSIYGSLIGVVDRISPDTHLDEVDKRIVYYRVYVRTNQAFLNTKDGRQHPIIPGMQATVEIKTGAKTVFDYLTKPLNKMREALRER